MNNILLKYNQCRNIIHEADVLLFKPSRCFGFGWLISRYTNSPYSHAALAHWDNDRLYALEFREFKGSRQYLLSDYINEGEKIDVFRPFQKIIVPTVKINDNNEPYNSFLTYDFNMNVAKNITKTACDLLGVEYSWWTIMKMAGTYLPFIRLKSLYKTDDEYFKTHAFVCSTLVTFSYRKNFIDPVRFLSDRYTTPGDLARSAVFHKLFGISS